MKKLMTISAVIAAAAMMAVSCQQEIEQPAEEPAARGVLTASFAEQTKVTYAESGSNLQPSWTVGDELLGIDNEINIYNLSVSAVSASGIATLVSQQTIPDGGLALLYMGGADINHLMDQSVIGLGFQSGKADKHLPAVMMAQDMVSDGSCHFTFSNLGAVVGISAVKGVPSGSAVTKINIEGENISVYVIDLSSGLSLSALPKKYDGVTTTGLSGVTVQDASGTLSSPVYLAVAGGGKIERVLVTTGTGDTYAYAPASPKTAAAGEYFYIKDQTFVETIPSPVPDNALSGEFSIGVERKVRFSKGNLQATYDGSKYTWGFAANQYDFVGNAAGNTTIDSQTSGAVVDLFGWSTGSTNYGISTSKKNMHYSGDFVDWGNTIGDGNTWFTLPLEEWQHLLSDQKYANPTREGLYAYGVTVAGKTDCLVLYPDGYDKTKVVQNGDTTSYDTTEEWAVAEGAGVVCLPAAGYRGGLEVLYYGGRYNSSTPRHSEYAQYLSFNSDGVSLNYADARYLGRSVRLVTKCW